MAVSYMLVLMRMKKEEGTSGFWISDWIFVDVGVAELGDDVVEGRVTGLDMVIYNWLVVFWLLLNLFGRLLGADLARREVCSLVWVIVSAWRFEHENWRCIGVVVHLLLSYDIKTMRTNFSNQKLSK